ncbi:MAG: filamentous hemagglutinin N-terminal domain-containing protein [Candidatus Symbiobacter sp.]|nr:filamentous hemagglutinin N-terminal domain-containing protein [Candidatus Symbiobacter sp.]
MLESIILPQLIINMQNNLKKLNNSGKFYRGLLSGSALGMLVTAGLVGPGMISPSALAAPTGGMVREGSGDITIAGNITTIAQTTPRAVINWQKFDVLSHETVRFQVPEGGATLNQIKAAVAPSHILGTVTSNGVLYFVNQNGFVFGPNSSVTAKNLLVTTQNLDSGQFIANPTDARQQFIAADVAPAKIILQGKVTVADHGFAVFFGPNIQTSETSVITANYGSVVLAAGKVDNFAKDQNGFAVFKYGRNSQGQSIQNDGIIRAAAGRVTLAVAAAESSYQGLVENNGSLDTRNGEDTGGIIALVAQNGVVRLNQGLVMPGKNGSVIYRQDKPDEDIIVDDTFLNKLHYESGVNLDLSSGYGLMVQSGLPAARDSFLTLHARVGLVVRAGLTLAGLAASSLFFTTDHPITVGAGGLKIISTGENWSYKGQNSAGITVNIGSDPAAIALLAQNGGDMSFIAQNGGRIFINNSISGHNVTASGNGIRINGTVTGNDIALKAENTGNIWLQGAITARNLDVVAAGGAVDFLGKIYLFNPDGTGGNLNAQVKSQPRSIEFHQAVLATNLRVANAQGNIAFDQAILSDDGSKLPAKIQVAGKGATSFATDVGVRPGGVFEIEAGRLYYRNINANQSHISIILTDPSNNASYNKGEAGKNAPNNNENTAATACAGNTNCRGQTSLELDEHIKFDHAPAAYFEAPGRIDVYAHVTAHDFTLVSQHNRFLGRSKIEVGEGGNINLTEYENSDFTANMLEHFGGPGFNGANLSLSSFADLRILAPLTVAHDRNVVLAGRTINFIADVTVLGGKATLIFNRQAGGLGERPARYLAINTTPIEVIFDQTINHRLKFIGDAKLEVQSYGNLTLRGDKFNFAQADFIVNDKHILSIAAPIAVSQHLGLSSDGEIYINQPVTAAGGFEQIKIVTPDPHKYLHYGVYGWVGRSE